MVQFPSYLLAMMLIIGQSGQGPPKAMDYSGKCTAAACHGSLVKHKIVHSPVADGACDSCHDQPDEKVHKFTLTEEGAALCLDCHEEFEGKVTHAPVADGSCTTCHNPHASEAKGLLNFDTQGELCADCHDDVLEGIKHLHAPVAASSCTACHNPHKADFPKLLKAEDGKLCATCHVDKSPSKLQGTSVHAPVTEGCLVCHKPHGGADAMMLTSAMPALCVDCHDGVEEQMDAAVTHDAVTKGKSCVNCHQPHASQQEKLLRSPSMKLCMSCHTDSVKENGGEVVLPGLGDQLKRPYLHGPVEQQDCLSCHKPHGGENFRMLAEAYPSTFYAPFSEDQYALCFDCHEAEAFEEAETDSATNFRNGKRNLHYLHVNKETKGRTCRACHEPHGANQQPEMADSVPFGAWRIPIQYKRTETGGSCQSGCHRGYRYDRENPVENIPAAKSPSDG